MNIEIQYGSTDYVTPLLLHSNYIIQTFKAETSFLDSMAINFGTYARINSGTMIFKILNENKNVLFNVNINVNQLLDNKYVALSEFNLFARTCSAIYGEPTKQHEKLHIWKDERSAIICELSNNEKNYFVYWVLI